MGARDYDPRLGRWLSADAIVPEPANPQSLNRYAYVYNNPLKYTDPSGHDPLDLDLDSLLLHVRVILLARKHADGDINVSIDLVRTEGEETTGLEITISSPDDAFPSFTTDEAIMAARINTDEAGAGLYFRGTDDQLRDATEALAWSMRNRIEVGEELEGGKWYRKEPNYTATFRWYDACADEPDSLVLETTVSVFVDSNRANDPLNGAIFVINREYYLDYLQTNPDLKNEVVYEVTWQPVLWEEEWGARPTYGVYFFRDQPHP